VICSLVKAYPDSAGPNVGFYLQYNYSSGRCELTSAPTLYHAFRAGDLKLCLKDGEAKGDYPAAAAAVKSQSVYYTDWTANYPYVLGTYAALSSDAQHTPLQCLKPVACASTNVPASPSTVWGVADPTKTFNWFDPSLTVMPDSVWCVLWEVIQQVSDPMFTDTT
jgi:hypothetical protein